jgi:hypothetical protein
MLSEEIESQLSYDNSATTWLEIDQLPAAFSLIRADLRGESKVAARIRAIAARMPTHVTRSCVG